MNHKRVLEATNNGCYFADCQCGESLGVYRSRQAAIAAHSAHVDGREPQGKVLPVIMFGPRPHGMDTIDPEGGGMNAKGADK